MASFMFRVFAVFAAFLLCLPVVKSGSLSWDVVDVDSVIQQDEELRSHLPTNVCNFDLTTSKKTSAEKFTGGYPVYISIATISYRIGNLNDIICKFLSANVIPTQIFVMVSEDKFLLDQGVSRQHLPPNLIAIVRAYPSLVSIVYTENIGPHRKLLPILKHFWEKPNTIIITFDDDFKNSFSFDTAVQELLKYHFASDLRSVVALRTRRIGLCRDAYHNEHHEIHASTVNTHNISVSLYKGWNCCNLAGSREMLVLPTGVGGVLYRPEFFHPVVFDPKFRVITATNDDLMFRLGTMAMGVDVVTACRQMHRKKEKEKEPSLRALSANLALDCPTSVGPIPELTYKTRSFTNGRRLQMQAPAQHQGQGQGQGQEQEQEQEQEQIRGWTGPISDHKTAGFKASGRILKQLQPQKEAGMPALRGGGGGSLWETLNSMESSLHQEHQVLPKDNLLVGAQKEGGPGSGSGSGSGSGNRMLNNDLMWAAATGYLRQVGVMDFHAEVLYPYATHERFGCFEELQGEIEAQKGKEKAKLKNILHKNCSVHYCLKKYSSVGEVNL